MSLELNKLNNKDILNVCVNSYRNSLERDVKDKYNKLCECCIKCDNVGYDLDLLHIRLENYKNSIDNLRRFNEFVKELENAR